MEEANAIGTAWLRAEAIGQPRGEEIARLVEQYTQLRLQFVSAGNDPSHLQALNQETNALQSRIWGNVAAVVQQAPNPVSTAQMSSVNDMFDASMTERFSYQRRLPSQLFWLLIGMTMVGMAATGYQVGLTGRTIRVLILLLTTIWTVVIVDILDLASARFGHIRTSGTAYEWAIQGFKGGLQIPTLDHDP